MNKLHIKFQRKLNSFAVHLWPFSAAFLETQNAFQDEKIIYLEGIIQGDMPFDSNK